MVSRVSKGIKGLDSLMNGGFHLGKVYLTSGEAGTEISPQWGIVIRETV